MKITIPNLRYIVRSVISEAWSKEKGFHANLHHLDIYLEEIERNMHILPADYDGLSEEYEEFVNAVRLGVESRRISWDVHTFEEAWGKPA